ncbi:hypothetical protein IWQ57_002122 [Coemansia nantahalensis]|uniref:Uncharacterized protein n=1 Tax=Coemansia nantahalensis TaxID=2789366 RepID=A0ACC1K1F0_9FUNG|nr:hypothetical protein IWQ57_002122 [Coemansia nantahalensis]
MLSRSAAIAGRQLRRARPRHIAPAGLITRRGYTNTSVYTRVDWMSHDELMKVILAEHQYLAELLHSDDSHAPWCRDAVDTVSRCVQADSHACEPWSPEQVFLE